MEGAKQPRGSLGSKVWVSRGQLLAPRVSDGGGKDQEAQKPALCQSLQAGYGLCKSPSSLQSWAEHSELRPMAVRSG